MVIMDWEIKELLDRLQTHDESCRIEAKESKEPLEKALEKRSLLFQMSLT
jgi:hypothetical protein